MKMKEESEKVALKLHSKNKDHGFGSHHFMTNRWGNKETVTDFILLVSKITADGDCSHKIKTCLLLGRIAMTNLGSILKSRDITLLTKVHIVKAMVFPVVMYENEIWTIKKAEHWRTELWCWRRLLRVCWKERRSNQSNLKEIKPVKPKGNQSKIFVGRSDVEAEAPLLWPPDVKNWFMGKDPDAGKDWKWEEKGTTEDEMVGWHHRLNGHEFEQTLGDGEGQESLACCTPWGCKESDMADDWTTTNQIPGRWGLHLTLS